MLLLLVATSAAAQSDRQYIREGNKLFHRGDYPNAEVAYRKAIEKNPKNPQAPFNLGNALMAQKKDSVAIEQFEAASRLETNPLRKAKSFHNIGVICQTHKMYGEAIEAYKNALRLNPNDDETRYNLVLCKHQKQKSNSRTRVVVRTRTTRKIRKTIRRMSRIRIRTKIRTRISRKSSPSHR